MIEKINNITFGIFKNYDWNKYLGKDTKFEKINIIYGRNYSGKTTLSRIIRAVETKTISEKYESPQFEISLNDESKGKRLITQSNYFSNNEVFRVFNEDFIRENLSFPYNDDGNIKSFALLGKVNVDLKSEIDKLSNELGNNEEEKETGLYKEQKSKMKNYEEANHNLDLQNTDLQNKLTNGARTIGNNSRSYNRNSLQNDISIVLKEDYESITEEDEENLKKILNETPKKIINELSKIDIDFQSLLNGTKDLVEQKIGDTEKIEELVKNAELNRWVKEGKKLHNGRKTCAFCGNIINEQRWAALDKHFDEEYEKLEKKINTQLNLIESEKENIQNIFEIEKESFYSSFDNKIKDLEKDSKLFKTELDVFFDSLTKQLRNKQNAMLENIEFSSPKDILPIINNFIASYNLIVKENNDYTSQLSKKQVEAQSQLKLQRVYDFCITIDYKNQMNSIKKLQAIAEKARIDFDNVKRTIFEKEQKIKELNAQMSNEKEGAKKINEYLVNFFDANHLVLDVEKDEDNQNDRQVTFSILRDGKRAYNLSEGECHIIAFCYFMATLNKDKEHKPIIWIDDPICSLDDNHICSVYSLIHSELRKKNNYEQLFVSTHNLDFFKYIKGLIYDEKKSQYMIIERDEEKALIKTMPNHMKIYATEFNYLFKQIYDCAHFSSSIPKDDDLNLFYNFGNNTRKFLEIFLYYEYPDMFGQNKDEQAMRERRKEFFGDEFETIFTRHYTNNFSHGNIERAAYPFSDEECKKLANLLINKIKENNNRQFDALCKSIGISNNEEEIIESSC